MIQDVYSAIRFFRKNKLIAIANTIGLTIGISACLIIFLIAEFELSFDKFHPNYDRVFRVYSEYRATNIISEFRGTFPEAVRRAKEDIPGIEGSADFCNWHSRVEVYSNNNPSKTFKDGSFIFCDSGFFKVFPMFKWLHGNAEHSLDEPYEVVLTRSRAMLYFGEIPLEQVIGKDIIYQDSLRFQVAGIVDDLEKSSDFTFSDFISYSTLKSLNTAAPFNLDAPLVINNSCQLFILIGKNTDQKQIESLFATSSGRNDSEVSVVPKLQPLSDLHFNSRLGIFDVTMRSALEKSTINVLVLVSLAVLFVAIVNFINLQTSQAFKRAKEVGVKKILGSSRWPLIRYFLIESLLLTLLSVLLSVALCRLMWTQLTELIPSGVDFDLSRIEFLSFILILVLLVSVFAGLYPAMSISSFQPINVVRTKAQSTGQSLSIRKLLTIAQFSFSQLLIIATAIVVMQINFLQSKNLGFSSENIMILKLPEKTNSSGKIYALKQRLERVVGVQSVSLQSQPPSGADGTNSILLSLDDDLEKKELWVNAKFGDSNYLTVYQIQQIAGRNFLEADSCRGYIINESYARKLGFPNSFEAVGKTLNGEEIIGVVQDFHTESLHAKIQPTVVACDERRIKSISIRIESNNTVGLDGIVHRVKECVNAIYQNEALETYFLDDKIADLYQSERRIRKLASFATIIAIILSCIGLFALSSFITLSKSKEIGIRKVLGASSNQILENLTFDFLKLVFLAFMISAPIAYLLSKEWLAGYEYKVDLSIWLFAASAMISLVIVGVTVSVHILRASRLNPVTLLRYE